MAVDPSVFDKELYEEVKTYYLDENGAPKASFYLFLGYTEDLKWSFDQKSQNTVLSINTYTFTNQSKKLVKLSELEVSCASFFFSDVGKKFLKEHYSITTNKQFQDIQMSSIIDETYQEGNSFVQIDHNKPDEITAAGIKNGAFKDKELNFKNTYFQLQKLPSLKENETGYSNDNCFVQLKLTTKENHTHIIKIKLSHQNKSIFE